MTQHFLELIRVFRLICFLALAAVSSFSAAVEPPLWIDNNAGGERQVHLYFFWTSTCPHCQMARSLDQEASSVPAFLFCGQIEVGFDRPKTTGRALEEALQSCRESGETRSGSLPLELASLPDSISRYSAQWRSTSSRTRAIGRVPATTFHRRTIPQPA